MFLYGCGAVGYGEGFCGWIVSAGEREREKFGGSLQSLRRKMYLKLYQEGDRIVPTSGQKGRAVSLIMASIEFHTLGMISKVDPW